MLAKENKRTAVIGELLQLEANATDDAERSRIGFMLLKYGGISDAAAIFRELTRSNPGLAVAHRGLGETYFDNGDYQAARRELQKALKSNSADEDSAYLLKLSASILELDPEAPRLNAAERLRRSRLLLERVLTDLKQCAGSDSPNVAAPAKQQFDDANQMLAARSRPSDPDQEAVAMQDSAAQLWKSRAQFCRSVPADKPLELVLSKIAQ
jgi:tetratricopeptide (TPR) repeat protein